MDSFGIRVIAHIKSGFSEKFGIPRQSGIVNNTVSHIVFEKDFSNPAFFKEIESYSHLWVLWHFSENKNENISPTVRPPRQGGNKRVGVFASRSPYRPSPIGLSCVEFKGLSVLNGQAVITVLGGDLLDGTPVFDIKPYVPYADCKINASDGISVSPEKYSATVIPSGDFSDIPKDVYETVINLLKADPRPAYKTEKTSYGLDYGGYEVKFEGEGNTLTLLEIKIKE